LTCVMTHAYHVVIMDAVQIRDLRINSIMSQEQLARSVGVAVRTVARWESGAAKPSPLALERLNHILSERTQTATRLKEKRS